MRESVGQLLMDRVQAKISPEPMSGCWLWTGYLAGGQGYGGIEIRGQQCLAHRVVYELLVGPIPEGLELDHLCRNRCCVNPDHLEAVTSKVNVLRGVGISAANAVKTHCVNGHEFTDENTYLHRGHRHCRKCGREESRTRQRRNRQLLKGVIK